MFWRRLKLWFVPSKIRYCRGCCIYCKHFSECDNDILGNIDLLKDITDR